MNGNSESDVNRGGNDSFIFSCSDAPMQTDDPLLPFLRNLDDQLTLACRLLREGHRPDLTAFEAQVGLLCATVLDRPIEQGRMVRPALIRLRERIAALMTDLASARSDA